MLKRQVQTKQKKLVTLLAVGMYLGSIVLFSSCASKHISKAPAPVIGVDIVELHKDDIVQFNGTEFSPFYLNEYLQWKANQ